MIIIVQINCIQILMICILYIICLKSQDPAIAIEQRQDAQRFVQNKSAIRLGRSGIRGKTRGQIFLLVRFGLVFGFIDGRRNQQTEETSTADSNGGAENGRVASRLRYRFRRRTRGQSQRPHLTRIRFCRRFLIFIFRCNEPKIQVEARRRSWHQFISD